MLQILEKLHERGIVHNDLKLENILVGNSLGKSLEKITLIDFGLCSTYRIAYYHIAQTQLDAGKGNLAFSSFQCLNGVTSSRRDDLISLLYLMMYLHCGDFRFLGVDITTCSDFDLLQAKRDSTAKSMCKGNLKIFEYFAEKILRLKFDEKPNYMLLRNTLSKLIGHRLD